MEILLKQEKQPNVKPITIAVIANALGFFITPLFLCGNYCVTSNKVTIEEL